MKTKTKSSGKGPSKELAESYVFPTIHSAKQEHTKLDAFRAIRKHIEVNETPESKLKSRLLELKFQMEEFLQSSKPTKAYYFGYFLKEYIIRTERNNRKFATEIKVNPTEITQVIRRNRKPTEKLIYRLDIHSNKIFPATVWFSILDKERNNELLLNKSIIDGERKNVASRLHIHL